MPRVTGERILAGPPEQVWALLTDAAELARAMPGAGEVEGAEGRSFRTTISLAVGPVKDTYEGRLAYEDEQRATARGRSSVTRVISRSRARSPASASA